MKKFSLIIFCFCCHWSISQINSCNHSLSGLIIDKHDGKPIVQAKIVIKETNKETYSDSSGIFKFENLCPSNFTLLVTHHLGCEHIKQSIQIDRDTMIYLFMESHFSEHEEAVVTYYKMNESPNTIIYLSPLEKLCLSGKSLGAQLEVIPGVQSLNTGGTISKPVIHGMHSNRVLVLNNGIRQEGQQWGSEHAPEIDVFLNSEISLVKGANSVRYGSEAIAGVVIVEAPKLSYKPGIRGVFEAAGFSNGRMTANSLLFEGSFRKLKGFYWRGQTSFKRNGDFHTPINYMTNTAAREFDFSYSLGYEMKRGRLEMMYSQVNLDLGVLESSHIGSVSDIIDAYSQSNTPEKGMFSYEIHSPKQRIEHELVLAKFDYRLNEKNEIFLNYGRQFNMRKEFDGHADDAEEADFILNLTTHSFSGRLVNQTSKKWTNEIGVDVMHQENTQFGRFLIPNYVKQGIGAFWVSNYKANNWEYELGIREDLNQLKAYFAEEELIVVKEQEFNNLSGNFGVSKKVGHHWVLKGNSGLAWRPPAINELYSYGVHHGTATFEVGTSNLRKEKAYNLQVGVEFKAKNIKFYTDIYSTHFDGFIYLEPQLTFVQTIIGAFPLYHFKQVNARFSGVDLNLERVLWKDFQYKLKYSFVRALNTTSNSFLVGIPSDRLSNTLFWGHTSTKTKKKIHLALTGEYVFKQTRFTDGAEFVNPPSDYMLLSFDSEIDININKYSFELGFTINNILNKTYRDYMNRYRYYSNEIGRNFSIKLKMPINYENNK
jgi:iron complex outermembrane recepter protein